MKAHNVFVLFVLTCMIGFAVPAWAGPGPYPPDPELHELRVQAWSLALLYDLGLNDEQRSEVREILSPLREELDAARGEMEAWRESSMKPHLKTVISELEAGRLPEPPSPETREAFRALKRKRIDLEIQAEAAIRRIQNILTETQKTALNEFHPRAYTGFAAGRAGLRSLFSGEPADAIRAIRSAPEEEFERVIQKLEHRLERDVPGRRDGRMNPERQEMRKERMQEMIEMMGEIREMPEEEYLSRLDALEAEFAAFAPQRRHGGRQGMMHARKGGPGMDDGGPKHGRGKRHEKKGRILNEILFSDAFFAAL